MGYVSISLLWTDLLLFTILAFGSVNTFLLFRHGHRLGLSAVDGGAVVLGLRDRCCRSRLDESATKSTHFYH